MYWAAEKPKCVTSDDLVLPDAEHYQTKKALMTKYWHVSYVFIITALVKLRWQWLGVPNFGNVKSSSAERSAWGLEACAAQ